MLLHIQTLEAALKPHINNRNSWQLVLFQVAMAVQLGSIKTVGYIKKKTLSLLTLKVWVVFFRQRSKQKLLWQLSLGGGGRCALFPPE